jgi:hypothetical protein
MEILVGTAGDQLSVYRPEQVGLARNESIAARVWSGISTWGR